MASGLPILEVLVSSANLVMESLPVCQSILRQLADEQVGKSPKGGINQDWRINPLLFS